MALPLRFVSSYLNVVERIGLDGDFHDFSGCSKHVHYLFQVKSGTRGDLHFVVTAGPDRLCGLAVKVPGYTTEMHCVSCEVRTEFIYVM
jgi:hypothetical protein